MLAVRLSLSKSSAVGWKERSEFDDLELELFGAGLAFCFGCFRFGHVTVPPATSHRPTCQPATTSSSRYARLDNDDG